MASRPISLARDLWLVAILACSALAGFALAGPQIAPAASIGANRSFARASISTAHFRFFSPESFWNAPVAPGAKLDLASSKLTQSLAAEVAGEQTSGVGPWINTTHYSVPIYTVPADEPTVRVRLAAQSPALQAAFEQVPLPATARGAAGSDGEIVVWQPSRNALWEFWRLVRTAEGPQASWGGAMRNVSSNPGVYGPEAWPEAQPWWGASASSLSIAGGLITFEDLQAGEINHALALAVPEVRAGVYAAPAKRTDGSSTNPLSLPEGAHLRLDPNLDIAALHLPRITRLIAEAAQRYGIFVRDGSTVVQFFAQDPVTLAKNPYTGAGGYFEGRYPSQLLASFPWSHLQLLKMELHPNE